MHHMPDVSVALKVADPGLEQARLTSSLRHHQPAASQGRQLGDQGRPGEILSPDIKKGCTV